MLVAGAGKPQQQRRGAVIGAAPKLNPEGILAAAREEKARKDAAAKKQQQVHLSVHLQQLLDERLEETKLCHCHVFHQLPRRFLPSSYVLGH